MRRTVRAVLIAGAVLALPGTVVDCRGETAAGSSPSAGKSGPGGSGAEAGTETWSQYLDRLDDEVRDVGRRIEELSRRAEKMAGKAKVDAQRAVKDLAEQRAKLEAEAGKLREAGENAWDKARKRVDSVLQELKRSVERMKTEFEPKKGEAI